ncbi:cell cycle checkpoint control protein [Capsaspora owczarzaki ATCC 30864]|uniref:Cell cycle checkpoint control protein RAD9A n=1 Tax=Capsaspora owczarzaki (strain ATCC 30864) TaxID=595528 RepID=A0A0D2X440_CAPO3|nr:cell cycle checkpoint control protein [Capsaspora owczarzaki ATCC 30864]
MQCVVPSRSLKAFGRAVHCCAKIGEEIYLEAQANQLLVRTVSLSRAAFACFSFAPQFFDKYRTMPIAGLAVNEQSLLKCKVLAKSCQHIFRSLTNIEKTVDHCDISLDLDESRLVFRLFCKHGITKTHYLRFSECDTLQAIYGTEHCVNQIACPGAVLNDSVVLFPVNLEEMTISVTDTELRLASYTEDLVDPKKVLHTEMVIQKDEFELFAIGLPADITFCLKEFKAILTFCDTLNEAMQIHFDNAGKPIILSVATDMFKAELVLATLLDPMNSSTTSSQQVPSSASQQQHFHPQSTPQHQSTPTIKSSPKHEYSSQQSASSHGPTSTGQLFGSGRSNDSQRPSHHTSSHMQVDHATTWVAPQPTPQQSPQRNHVAASGLLSSAFGSHHGADRMSPNIMPTLGSSIPPPATSSSLPRIGMQPVAVGGGGGADLAGEARAAAAAGVLPLPWTTIVRMTSMMMMTSILMLLRHLER